MIDWITCIFPCTHNHKIYGHSVTKITADGVVEWTTDKGMHVKGSHDSTIMIKSNSENELYVSGNPAKFLQGHNIFGSDDLVPIAYQLFSKLTQIKELNLTPTSKELDAIKKGLYPVKRVDVNRSWHLESLEQVIAWINSASVTAHMRRRGQGILTGTTLYWAKNSRRSSLKCYAKGQELNIKGHRLPQTLTPEAHSKLTAFANKSLRFEATFRGLWLTDNGYELACKWTPENANMELRKMIDQLEISGNMKLTPTELDALSPSLKMAYLNWLNGQDMKSLLTKPTFYRYRSQLLEYGIDIAIKQDEKNPQQTAVPLLKVLEAKPVETPAWAYELDLIA